MVLAKYVRDLIPPARFSRQVPSHVVVSFAARHVIGGLLDLSHISWRTCVADQLSDHRPAAR